MKILERMRLRWRRIFPYRVCPKVMGYCPGGYSGRHITSTHVDDSQCLLCGAHLAPAPRH